MAVPTIYLGDIRERPKVFTVWEKYRVRKEVHWLVECFAESLGVFFYVYAGVGSTANFVIGNIIQQPGLSSVLQVGFGYAFGILFALGVCAGTSGGHFNPCVTIAFILFKGFPKWKAVRHVAFGPSTYPILTMYVRYIIAQIFGAYIACLVIYAQYKVLIVECEGLLRQANKYDELQFTPNGLAGIFALYLLPGQTMGRVFLNEFVTDVFLALIIWSAIDPANILIPPVLSPFIVAVAYAAAIWGFGTAGLAANSARDVGGRFLAMTIWGVDAAGGKYAAIAALTNIPATLFAACMYEFFLADSDRVVPAASLEFGRVMENHKRLRKHRGESRRQSTEKSSSPLEDKPDVIMYENAA
ncbi:putative aquaporin 2 [Collybia nuda]|uniref:Aquaporin 2 n=1 Tax=Collybia nuda TaxID=64659 RepID=A0A9P5YF35_9AGAR|nr:putative aquaporin 2 [Collybia nuda]